MNTFQYSKLSASEIQRLVKRPKMDFTAIFETVQPIIDAVQASGDEAVRTFTKKFDGVELSDITINPAELEVKLDSNTKTAIDTAFNNIKQFHEAQKTDSITVETMPGVSCSRFTRAIERVGIYVPGGTAILPSTAMMLAIPAMLAGCSTIVLATPPKLDGSIAPEIIYIAQKTGVQKILLAGGAQAIAALAFGTESVPKVDKILGPGNQFVTAAKMISRAKNFIYFRNGFSTKSEEIGRAHV